MNVFRISIAVLFCLLAFVCWSQKPDLRFHHINSLNGLSHGFTRKVVQDHKGYMWFATADGLNKYDGYKMTVYKTDPENPNSISSNDVLTLTEDHDGNLWIGTSKGLNLYLRDQDYFVHFPEIGDAFITSLMEDSHQQLWVSSKKNIFKFDKKKKYFQQLQLEEKDMAFFYLFEDSFQTFWVATFEGIAILDRTTGKIILKNEIPVKDISCIYEDRDHFLWIGSRVMGVLRYNLKDASYRLFQDELQIPNNVVLALNGDPEGRIWIGTENGGLSLYDPTNNQFYHYLNNPANPESLCFNTVYSITVDRTKNIWLGTYTGVELVKKDKFTHIRPDILNPNTLSGSNILSFCEDLSGNIWIGTDGQGLDKFDPETGTFTHYKHDPNNPHSLSSNAITYLKEDKEGNLWIGTWGGGLNLFDRKKGSFIRFQKDENNPSSIQNDNVAHIYEDHRGNLWVGVGSGIELLDREKGDFQHYNYYYPKTLLGSYPGDILEDHDGNLWIGTFDGLCIFDRDKNKIIEFPHSDKDKSSISSNVIYTLFEDKKNNLWIGTVGGLNKFNKKSKTFEDFHVKDGLPSDAIYGILEDDKGYLWISTSNGISKFDPRSKTFKNYNVDDGLQGNEFKQNAFLKLKNGSMLFGGDKGFNLFHPSQIKDNPMVPPVLITDFKLFNKPVPIGTKDSPLKKSISETKELILSYKNSVISFEFAALSYLSPERNQYAYKLEGLEDEWNYVGNKREATYTSLDPGEYTFRVKASNNDGIWNEKGPSLKIIITPPFWKTWWFKALILLSFVVILNTFIRLRINQYRKQREILKKLVQKKTKEIITKNEILEKANLELNRQKEEILNQKNEILEMSIKVKEADEKKLRFFSNISHEIRTPLTLILGPAEKIAEKTGLEASITQDAGMLYKNARRLLTLVNELIDFHKMDNEQMKVLVGKGDIVKFCFQTVGAFQEFSEKKNINLSFFSTIEYLSTWFDSGKLEVVLYNLISNAFKFTQEKGQITVNFEAKVSHIEISVSDNGIGIESEKIDKIFDRYYQIESSMSLHNGAGLGLAYTKELVELMDGRISVESAPGINTTFTVILPLLNEDLIKESEKYVRLAEDQLINRENALFELSENKKEKQESNPPSYSELKILIVDDNEDIRQYIKSCLGKKFVVLEGKNGKEGLGLAKEHQPSLIISDVMMPEMDGMEFCKRVKEDLEISHIPVMLLTAKTNEESKIEGFGQGADDYVVKPFSQDLLLVRIENLIETRNKLRNTFKEKVILDPREITVSSPDEKLLAKAFEIVENNIHNSEFDATEFVKEMGMSRSLVYMKLKELINLSPAELIKSTRLKRASQLLKEKKHRISDVCYMVGFTDPHYFTISFKKLFGKTPTEYIEGAE